MGKKIKGNSKEFPYFFYYDEAGGIYITVHVNGVDVVVVVEVVAEDGPVISSLYFLFIVTNNHILLLT